MGKGAGTASFAAGFGRGLSKALLMNRERSDQKNRDAQAQKDRVFQLVLPQIMQNMQDPSDLQPLLETYFPEVFQQGKGSKKGGGAFDKLAGFLGPLIGMRHNKGTTIESGWPGGPVTMGPGGHIGMDSPEQGGITGMLGRSPGPFGRQPEQQQPPGVSGGIIGNVPDYSSEPKEYGLRPDGTPKGNGFLGRQPLRNGGVATEYSIGTTDVNGQEMDIPTLVPTLTPDEIQATLRAAEAGTAPPASVMAKAVAHAKMRLSQGKSVFAQEGEQQQGGFASLLRDVPPDISQTPFGGGVQPPSTPVTPPRRTLFGVPMMTPEESATRAGRLAGVTEGAKTEAELNAKMAIARRMVETGAATNLGEAMDRLGLRRAVTGSTAIRYGGILKGDQAGPGTEDVYGRPLDPNTYYRLQIQPDMSLSYTPTVAPGGNLGVDREALSRAMFNNKSYAQLTPEQQQKVLDEEIKRGGEKTAATTSARIAEEAKAPLTTKQKFDLLMSLQDDWRKADNPAREMQRQLQLMETGLKRAKADPVGGSQAVLVTFQKILDPASVVRESEYARSGAGLALMDRLQGLVERYSQGGAGVPLPVLEQMTETARQFLVGMKDWNDIERERIGSTAKDAGVNPDRVFGVAAAAGGGGGSAGASGPITLDTPIYIDPVTKKPTTTPPKAK